MIRQQVRRLRRRLRGIQPEWVMWFLTRGFVQLGYGTEKTVFYHNACPLLVVKVDRYGGMEYANYRMLRTRKLYRRHIARCYGRPIQVTDRVHVYIQEHIPGADWANDVLVRNESEQLADDLGFPSDSIGQVTEHRGRIVFHDYGRHFDANS